MGVHTFGPKKVARFARLTGLDVRAAWEWDHQTAEVALRNDEGVCLRHMLVDKATGAVSEPPYWSHQYSSCVVRPGVSDPGKPAHFIDRTPEATARLQRALDRHVDRRREEEAARPPEIASDPTGDHGRLDEGMER